MFKGTSYNLKNKNSTEIEGHLEYGSQQPFFTLIFPYLPLPEKGNGKRLWKNVTDTVSERQFRS